jgi:hypothetical protein
MSLPNGEAPLIVLKYALGRKEFYRNTEKTYFVYGDIVATVASQDTILGL